MADERFAALSTDPRYRFPSRKKSKTAVDPRFRGAFTDPEFQQKASVDRYGRKIGAGVGDKKLSAEKLRKPARTESNVKRADPTAKGRGSISSEEDGDSDEKEQALKVKDPAREGGFSESSSDEESSSESESEVEAELAAETAGQEQTEDVPTGDVTHRLAAVNLDWDNFQAADIFAVASVFLPAGGRIESVIIYPSEFGRERMEYEDLHGPPKDIFAGSKRRQVDVAEDHESDEDVEDEEAESDDDEDEKVKRKLLNDQVQESAGETTYLSNFHSTCILKIH